MKHNFTLEYWIDDGWYIGQLKEVPSVFSQGETLEELEKNIQEVYSLLFEASAEIPLNAITKEMAIEV
jgi:predicted RNase H-like HicB family nuclease